MKSLETRPDGSPLTRKQAVAEPSSSRVVPKPVPASQAKDPRQYQLEQLRRRYKPKESTAADGTTSLVFKLVPSDPDFPFELAHLDCDLRVPADYPEERPVLLVKNPDIPRGFSINIERGWDSLAEEKSGATLLALTRELDKHLERFLSEQKVETVKFVAFKDTRDTRHLDAEMAAVRQAVPEPAPAKKPAQAPAPAPVLKPYVPEPWFSKEEIAAAKARRAREVHQLEARMKRGDSYHRSPDGIVYTLPIEPRRRNELPEGLREVSTVHFIVPLLYPLQDLRIQLNEANPEDAERVEELFTEKARSQPSLSLMSHLSYLVQNIHRLAKEAEKRAPKVETPIVQAVQEPAGGDESQPTVPSGGDKSHIQVIPRPPEWSLVYGEDDSDEDYTDLDEDDGGVALGGEEGEPSAPENPPAPAEAPERGTMMSFPSVELRGIELLQVSILSLSVKCERCKTVNDMTNLKPGVEKTSSCKKCATPFTAVFRAQLVHEHSSRAGSLEFSGCRVADMLPSTFVPTCAGSSTPSSGLLSVRGETTVNICRECHARFSFKIPDVKFLLLSPTATLPPPSAPLRRREKLGLHAGEPLPDRGACAHYRRSYRWFRFSCCSRVHACDRCHDAAEDHINEWATRMICGWCSREQNYAVEACGFCGRSVIGRKGKGFWEGGKGTRDQRTMSRKDPRKHKRIGGSQAAKKE